MFRRLLALLLLFTPLSARGDYREFQAVPVDAALGSKLTRVAETILKEYPKLTADNLSLSVIDLTKPENIVRADYHGDVSFYPASLVKLFFMVETYHQARITPEIERALREMIQGSDNDAAAFLLDVLTDTAAGNGDFPGTEELAMTVLNIPISPHLGDDAIAFVICALQTFGG